MEERLYSQDAEIRESHKDCVPLVSTGELIMQMSYHVGNLSHF